jgi:hypothetical protein
MGSELKCWWEEPLIGGGPNLGYRILNEVGRASREQRPSTGCQGSRRWRTEGMFRLCGPMWHQVSDPISTSRSFPIMGVLAQGYQIPSGRFGRREGGGDIRLITYKGIWYSDTNRLRKMQVRFSLLEKEVTNVERDKTGVNECWSVD